MTPLLTSTPCVGHHPMSTPPGDHPATPTAPRVSAEPEESNYPTHQHLRSPSLGDADLRLIQARHSQGLPIQPPPTDPASPEVDEPWYSDPVASVDRGGWENPRARSHETPKQTAPLTTSTPQTAPQPTTTPTRTTTLGIYLQAKESPATSSSPGGPPTAEMPSLQELWQKMSRFLEAQEAQHKLATRQSLPSQPLPTPHQHPQPTTRLHNIPTPRNHSPWRKHATSPR